MFAIAIVIVLGGILGADAEAKRGKKRRGKDRDGQVVQAPEGAPNVVIFLTDDMRAEDWKALPRTQARLAALGTTFDNFTISNPVCCPSRTTLLTGMHSHNNGVLTNDAVGGGYDQFRQNDLADDTIAYKLQQAGWRTALIGKFLNGYEKGVPQGWDYWFASTTKHYWGPTFVENGNLREYGNDRYVNDVVLNKARNFIEGTNDARPIFLYVSLKAPHGPSDADKGDRGTWAGAQVPRTAAFNEADVSDKPAFVRGLPTLDAADLDALERKRLDSLESADKTFAAILDALEAEGRLDNAYVFALSDNGYLMGEHRLQYKSLPYDAVARVPMIAVGPGFAPGATDGRLAQNVDVAPTIAAATGVDLPRADGRSLLEAWDREAVLLEGWVYRFAALRGKDFLYVEHASGEREYYDYRADPHELDNLLADWKGHSPTLDPQEAQRLHDLLASAKTCAGSTCP